MFFILVLKEKLGRLRPRA